MLANKEEKKRMSNLREFERKIKLFPIAVAYAHPNTHRCEPKCGFVAIVLCGRIEKKEKS